MGLNKWQEIIIEDMQKAEALASIDNSNWWSTDLNFDEVNTQNKIIVNCTQNILEDKNEITRNAVSALQNWVSQRSFQASNWEGF